MQKAVDKWFRDAPGTYKKYIFYTNDAIEYAIKLEIIDKNPMKILFVQKLKMYIRNLLIFILKKNYRDFYNTQKVIIKRHIHFLDY